MQAWAAFHVIRPSVERPALSRLIGPFLLHSRAADIFTVLEYPNEPIRQQSLLKPPVSWLELRSQGIVRPSQV